LNNADKDRSPDGLKYRPKYQAYTQAPTPPASTCYHVGAYDLTSIISKPIKYFIGPRNQESGVSYALCDTVPMACGEAGMPCAVNPRNCSGICQFWTEADGPVSANLGRYSLVSFDAPTNTITFTYLGGDQVQGVPRAAQINLTCGPRSGAINTTSFTMPSGHEPNEPYWYFIDATTNLMCDGCTNYGRQGGCDTCTRNGCNWCFDTNTCISNQRAPLCANRVKNPSFCRQTSAPIDSCNSFNTCGECTMTNQQCEWCFDKVPGTCFTAGYPCGNVVSNSSYCFN